VSANGWLGQQYLTKSLIAVLIPSFFVIPPLAGSVSKAEATAMGCFDHRISRYQCFLGDYNFV